MEPPSSSPGPAPFGELTARAYFLLWSAWLSQSRALVKATFWATWWQKLLTLWLLSTAVGALCHRLPMGPLERLCEFTHHLLEQARKE